MEEWRHQVAAAIEDFSSAKARERRAFSALEIAENEADQTRAAQMREIWFNLRQCAQQKNEIAWRLIQAAVKP